MKLDLNQKLKNFAGEPMRMGNAMDSPEATLKMVIVEALSFPEDRIDGMEKMKRFTLAQKVFESSTCDFTVEEVALIKQMIGKVFPPLVVGRTWEMLK